VILHRIQGPPAESGFYSLLLLLSKDGSYSVQRTPVLAELTFERAVESAPLTVGRSYVIGGESWLRKVLFHILLSCMSLSVSLVVATLINALTRSSKKSLSPVTNTSGLALIAEARIGAS